MPAPASLKSEDPHRAPMGLPERPRLKPHIAIVPVARDNVLLKGPDLFVRFSGEAVPALLSLAERLDGTRTVGELARDTGLSEEDVRDLLEALAADKALEDAAHDEALLAPAEARAALTPQLRLLSHLTANPALAQNRLTRARVLVVGRGEVARLVAEHLRAMGVGRVETHEPSDVRLVFAADLAALVKGADHVVLAADAPTPQAFLEVNDAALAAGIEWTGAFLDGLAATVGPTVIPFQSACWRCYDLRAKGAHPNLERLLAYEAHVGAPPPPVALPTFAASAAASCAQAVVLTLARTGMPPLAGHVQRFSFLDMRAERHRVLRIPRCPSCTRASIPDVDRYSLEPVTLS